MLKFTELPKTPIGVACGKGFTEIVRLLLTFPTIDLETDLIRIAQKRGRSDITALLKQYHK